LNIFLKVSVVTPAAFLAVSLMLAGCDKQTDSTGAGSRNARGSAANAAIVRKVVILAEMTISVPEMRNGSYRRRISDAHQEARLLMAEYTSGDRANLEADVSEMFSLLEQFVAEYYNVIQLQDANPTSDSGRQFRDEVLRERTAIRDRLSAQWQAKKSEILSKYGN
jgi:hypothetical protein